MSVRRVWPQYAPTLRIPIVQGRNIEENMAISSRRHFSPFGLLRPKKEAELAERFIARLRVRTPSRKQDIINLSGGNQQKVILGRWLSEQGVKVLIIDEPTRGIDVGTKQQIYHFIAALAREGRSIIVVSSELPEVIGLCTRVAVMREGQLVGMLEGEDISEQMIMRYAAGLRRQRS